MLKAIGRRPRHPGVRSAFTSYYFPANQGQNGSNTTAVAANIAYYGIFDIPGGVVDRLGIDVATGSAGAARLGLVAFDAHRRAGLLALGERIEGEWQANRFELLLTTGGPAVRIMGELDECNEPTRAWLEVQDWGTPWTPLRLSSDDEAILVAFSQRFYFGG
jgi:hypothetical protein